MRVRLFSNETETFVTPFVGRFTANVCKAIVDSLKAPPAAGHIHFIVERGLVHLKVDDSLIVLDRQGFAETIVRDTIRGMVRNLKGIDPEGAISIEVDLEGNS